MAHIDVVASASDTLSGTAATAESDLVDRPLDPGDAPDSGIDAVNVQQTSAAPARPQLRVMNPDRPVRYIPIHIW